LNPPPGGLYIHVPFCARICPYCDFAVRKGDTDEKQGYVRSLLAEIDLWAGEFETLDTIYFGGGTPSSLTPSQLATIVDALRASFTFAEDTRVFLEANPEDVTAESARQWRDLGVATLSLGVQSLADEGLQMLGRVHTVEQLKNAVTHARDAAFPTLSIDLIYGRPGQTLDGWRGEMRHALDLRPDHVSAYQLTIHPRTRFGALSARGRLVPLSETSQGEFFRATHQTMSLAGMEPYEVSQFASGEPHHSRHNTKYWRGIRYLGLGPSAHSFVGERRWWNHRKLKDWQAVIATGKRPVDGQETLTVEQQILERLMIGFRTVEGVDAGAIRDRFGVDLGQGNQELLEGWQQQQLVTVSGDHWRPTLEGLAIADTLAAGVRYASPTG